MSNFSNKRLNYCLRILSDYEYISDILNQINILEVNYKYKLRIYMVNKNEEFFKIKKMSDIKDYAIILDDNGSRKVILSNNGIQNAKIHSVYLIHELLYNFGYYELFYVNEDIHQYTYNELKFDIIEVKNEGIFLKIDNICKNEYKELVNKLKKEGIKLDLGNNKVDIEQLLLDKALPKK